MTITVRPLVWRDLPYLYRNRSDSVFLDSALVLTRGPHVVSGALLSYLTPGMGIFTGVSSGQDQGAQPTPGRPVIGQIIHLIGSPFAHLTFVTPDEALDSPALPALLEYLITIAGERGAFRLLADVDEQSMVYEALRHSSFAIYTRQRIWQLNHPPDVSGRSRAWRGATSRDTLAIKLLYNNLVPGLVQQVEPFMTNNRPRGVIHQQGEDLFAYVEIRYGNQGIWVHPFIHPDTQDVAERFIDLVQNLSNRGGRPVYICVRSYQSWLEPAIEAIGAEGGPRLSVMVRNLASLQKAPRAQTVPTLEGSQPEVTAPMARLQK
jgi:hypothetical protein